MTVGKINLGLKANVLIVPFLVEDIDIHVYIYPWYLRLIYQDLYLHNFLSIVFKLFVTKYIPLSYSS